MYLEEFSKNDLFKPLNLKVVDQINIIHYFKIMTDIKTDLEIARLAKKKKS